MCWHCVLCSQHVLCTNNVSEWCRKTLMLVIFMRLIITRVVYHFTGTWAWCLMANDHAKCIESKRPIVSNESKWALFSHNYIYVRYIYKIWVALASKRLIRILFAWLTAKCLYNCHCRECGWFFKFLSLPFVFFHTFLHYIHVDISSILIFFIFFFFFFILKCKHPQSCCCL